MAKTLIGNCGGIPWVGSNSSIALDGGAGPSSYHAAVQADSPQLWYKLGETDKAGVYFDSGAAGLDGYIKNPANVTALGYLDAPIDTAVNPDEDGAVNYASEACGFMSNAIAADTGDVTDAAAASGAYWECWVQSNTAGTFSTTTHGAIMFALAQGGTFGIWATQLAADGSIYAAITPNHDSSAGRIIATTTETNWVTTWDTDDAPHHIAASFTGDAGSPAYKLFLYIDGVEKATATGSANMDFTDWSAHGHDLRVTNSIARSAAAPDAIFTNLGSQKRVDECAFYRRYFTAAEVLARYQLGTNTL